VDEFIQDAKGRFPKLHKEHGDDIKQSAIEKGKTFLANTALYVGKDSIPPREGELDANGEEYRQMIRERTLKYQQVF